MGGSASTLHGSAEPNLAGKNILITGGTSGIGLSSVAGFLEKGAHVIVAARNEEKFNALVPELKEKVKERCAEPQISFLKYSMNDLEGVKASAKEFAERGIKLDVLVNNAGMGERPFGTTAQGIEETMGCNHFATFTFTLALIQAGVFVEEGARIVILSSAGYPMSGKKLDWSWYLKPDESRHGSTMSRMTVYSESKWANMLFARELSRRWKGGHVFAVDPGFVSTNFLQDSGRIFKTFMSVVGRSADKGAESTLVAALAPGIEEHNGLFFDPKGADKRSPTPIKKDHEAVMGEEGARMWAVSLDTTGLPDLE